MAGFEARVGDIIAAKDVGVKVFKDQVNFSLGGKIEINPAINSRAKELKEWANGSGLL